MNEPPLPNDAPPTRPAGDQFTLRGMFLLMTAVCIILGVLALSIKTPLHWLGLGFIPAFCLIVIGCLELVYHLRPPPPRYVAYRSPFAPYGSPFQGSSQGENPFAQPPSGEPPLASSKEPRISDPR